MYDSKSNVGSVYGVFGGGLLIVLSVSGEWCVSMCVSCLF